MHRLILASFLVACGAPAASTTTTTPTPAGPPVIDRFSATAGHLQVRTATNGLPGPGVAVDFDQPPFKTQSLGPAGEVIRYYNLDVQPATPGTIYQLVDAAGAPVDGAAPVLATIPGEPGYSDFMRVVAVTVPAGADLATLRDAAALATLPQAPSGTIVNWPVVPAGSTATERMGGAPTALTPAWYRGFAVDLLRFDEGPLSAPVGGTTPTSPIFPTFRINPGEPGGGPPSGFMTEADGIQTHTVASSLPGDLDYSALWSASPYDNAAFAQVRNLSTVLAAKIIMRDAMLVNCPVVFVGAPR